MDFIAWSGKSDSQSNHAARRFNLCCAASFVGSSIHDDMYWKSCLGKVAMSVCTAFVAMALPLARVPLQHNLPRNSIHIHTEYHVATFRQLLAFVSIILLLHHFSKKCSRDLGNMANFG
eukprot:3352319-Amphidinium_carterae.1